MAQRAKTTSSDHQAFKRALDKQNRLETATDEASKRERDAAEGQAAHRGLPAQTRSSKGRPKKRD